MKIILKQIELSLDYTETQILRTICNKLQCKEKQVHNYKIIKRSIDARSKRKFPVFIVHIKAEVSDITLSEISKIKNAGLLESDPESIAPPPVIRQPKKRPIIIGSGPAGLMATFHLAAHGLKPILYERGFKTEQRTQAANLFWKKGILDKENNILYGEGGAGLFSDGKLTSRSKNLKAKRLFLETIVNAGADKDILIDSEPHLGSDKLQKLVPEIRKMIHRLGGETHYESRLQHLLFTKNKLAGAIINNQEIKTEHLILSTGHSARDVFRMLHKAGVCLEPKPFAVGVRVEIPQLLINKGQYGDFAEHPRLKTASFRVTRKAEAGVRSCYSFCMCPGGMVICCASEPNMITTNGMSFAARSGFWGNAAFLVPVEPSDLSSKQEITALDGLDFQEKIERAGFKAAGKNYFVPTMKLTDFLQGKVSDNLPNNLSCIRTQTADFNYILPDFVTATLKNALPKMLKEISFAAVEQAFLYAPETRSSSPVRIVRDKSGQSVSYQGLYPAGEGSGYAGGIVSSAIDGINAAESIIRQLS